MQPLHPRDSGKYPHGKTGLRRIFHTLIHSRDGFIATFRAKQPSGSCCCCMHC